MDTNNGRLHWISDRLEIQDVISAVSLHSDMKEFDEIPQYYTADAVVEYPSIFGMESAIAPVLEHRARVMTFLPHFDVTNHQVTNFQIKINGDKATCRSQVRAVHRIGPDIERVGGTYHHELRRTAEGWRICYHRFDRDFIDGPNLIAAAQARGEADREMQV